MNRRTPSLEIVRQRFVGSALPGPISETELGRAACPSSAPSIDPVPDFLRKLFAERQAARHASWPAKPEPGVIVQILPKLGDTDPSGPIEPLALLLDREISPSRWRAWLVVRDVGYAAWHDLILGPEDQPRDPQCQVVQVWNATVIETRIAQQVLSRLSEETMAAIRSMERDLAENRQPGEQCDTRMGVQLARELTDGTGVVTGTPASAPDDPRHGYGDLYRQAGEWVGRQSSPRMQHTTSHASRWLSILIGSRLGLAATAILVIGVSVLLFRAVDTQIGTSPVGASYISGHGIYQRVAENPAETALAIERRLRLVGVNPEIRHEEGGSIVIQADLSGLTDTSRTALLAELSVSQTEKKLLTLMLIKGQQ